MKKSSLFFAFFTFVAGFAFAIACQKPDNNDNSGKDEPEYPEEELNVSVGLAKIEAGEDYLVFSVDASNVTECAWLLKSTPEEPSAETILSKGVPVKNFKEGEIVRVENLQPGTRYYIFVAVRNSIISQVFYIDIETKAFVPEPTASIAGDGVTSSSISFTVTYSDAEQCRYVVAESPEGYTAESVLSDGVLLSESGKSVTVDGLKEDTQYYVLVAVSNSKATKLIAPLGVKTFPGLVTFQSSGVKYNNDTNWTLTFTSEKAYMEIDFYSASSTMLSEGEYKLGSTGVLEFDKKYSYFCKDKAITDGADNRSYFTEGKAVVSLDENKKYKISFEFVTEDGAELKAEFYGDISGIDFSEPATSIELNATEAKRVDVNNPLPGEFYIRLNDTKWSFEAIIDFYADPSATELPAGVYYVASVAGTKGTVGPKTEFSIYGSKTETYKFVSGMVRVIKSGEDYKFEYSLITASDFLVKGVFNGKINNMNLSE
ncbi:MAG: hypothetical protein ACI3ZN_00775 [Candidatus Cryptobacteroides sp.]